MKYISLFSGIEAAFISVLRADLKSGRYHKEKA